MTATIDITCVVADAKAKPPRGGTHLQITISQFFGRQPPLGIPDLRNPIVLPPVPFSGTLNTQVGVGDVSVPYWIDLAVLPGGSPFFGIWNDTFDVGFVNPGPFDITDGGVTAVSVNGSLTVHQHL